MNGKQIKNQASKDDSTKGLRIMANPTASKSLVVKTMKQHGIRMSIHPESNLGQQLAVIQDTSCTVLLGYDLDQTQVVVLVKVAKIPEIHVLNSTPDEKLVRRMMSDCTRLGLLADCKCPSAVFVPRTRVSRAIASTTLEQVSKSMRSDKPVKVDKAKTAKTKIDKTSTDRASKKTTRKQFRLNQTQDAILLGSSSNLSIDADDEAKLLDKGIMLIRTDEDVHAWIEQANYYSSKRIVYENEDDLMLRFGSGSAIQLINKLTDTKTDLTGVAVVKVRSINRHVNVIRNGTRKR